jgi:hypothetical protein
MIILLHKQFYGRILLLRRKLFLFSAAILSGVAIYFNTLYVFSPFNLKTSEITKLCWQDVKYPIQVEYYTYETNKGWVLNKTSNDKSEIRLIVKAFESLTFVTESTSDIPSLKLLPHSERGKENLVVLRRVNNFNYKTQYEGVILFKFTFYQNDDYGTVNSINYFKISKEFKDYIILQNEKLN